MATLSAAIVKHRVASMRDVEEALARQALYGGDLTTNLLEVSDVGEAELTQVLALSLGLQAAPEGELPRSSEATLRLVPAELAERHGLYPLEELDGTLLVAISEQLPLEVEADLGFALGVTIVQRAAPLVRVRQAISRDYGSPLALRLERLLAKLDGLLGSLTGPFGREHGSGAGGWPLPQPGSVPPVALETPPAREAAAALSSEHAKHLDAPAGGPPTPRLTHGGRPKAYGPAVAEQDLAAATTRDEVLSAFFDFSAQHFDYCALFVVQGEMARGRDAHGPGRDRSTIGQVTLTLDPSSSLGEIRQSGRSRLLRLTLTGHDQELTQALRRPTGQVVLFLPVTVKGRTVLILYGDRGFADLEPADAEPITSLVPLVSAALERVIVQRKRLQRGSESEPPPFSEHLPFSSESTRPRALAPLQEPAQEAPGPPSPPPTPASEPTRESELTVPIRTLEAESAGMPEPAAPQPAPQNQAEHTPPEPPSPPAEPEPGPAAPQSAPQGQAERAPPEPSRQSAAGAPSPRAEHEPMAGQQAAKQTAAKPAGITIRPVRIISAVPSPPTTAEAETAPQTRKGVAPNTERIPPGRAGALRNTQPLAPRSSSEGSASEKAGAASGSKPLVSPPAQDRLPPLPADLRASLRHQPGPLEYRLLRRQGPAADATEPERKPSVSMAPVVQVGGSARVESLRPRCPSDWPDVGAETNSDAPLPLMRRSGHSAGTDTGLASTGGAVASGMRSRKNTPRGIAPLTPVKPAMRDQARPSAGSASAPNPDRTPEIAVASVEMGEDWAVEDGAVSTDGKAPLAPVSRYVQYGARAPRPSQPSRSETALPSIIVDVESDCLQLLERLLGGDESAQSVLVEMGGPAAEVLAARLPGPLTNPAGHSPGRLLVPSRSGPLLAALVHMGEPSVPFVVKRTTDPDPTVRLWATRILGELPWPDSAHAVAQRLTDENEDVRRAALAAGRMLEADRASRDALRETLLQICSDKHRPGRARSWAALGLGELREQQSIPALIILLDEDDRDVAAAVQRALVALTAQDFGPSRTRYTSWWVAHSKGHRIEWLIDALTSESGEIRRTAGEELKTLTKEYFGYYDDLPPRERSAAQERYREWWNTRGKALFG